MNNNKLMIGVVAAAIVVVLVIVLMGRSSNAPTTSMSPGTSAEASASTSESGSTTPVATRKVTTSTKATTPPSALSYQEAVKKYGGNRIQFDLRCQAIPSQIVIKAGTTIMLDNRISNSARTLSIGAKSYTMPAQGYSLVTPSSSTLPATLLIDCAGYQQNVGRIVIQR